MRTVTTTGWVVYQSLKDVIDFNNEALSTLRLQEGWSIVRRTLDGQFAVIAINGSRAKIVKVLPTLDRARSYNFAIAR